MDDKKHIIRVPESFPLEYFEEKWKVYKSDCQINMMDTLLIILNEFSRFGLVEAHFQGVPLNNTALCKVCGNNFKKVKKELLEFNKEVLIQTDGSYAIGVRSIKYKLGYTFIFDDLKTVKLQSESRLFKYKEYLDGDRKYRTEIQSLPNVELLNKQFFDLNLKLDKEVYEYKRLYINYFIEKIKKAKNAKIKFLYYSKIGHLVESISRVENRDYSNKLSPRNLRYNSIFTYLKKELRYFLRVDEDNFIELDLSASHAYVLATILNSDFFLESDKSYSLGKIFKRLKKIIENYIDAGTKALNSNNIKESQAGAGRRRFPHMSSRFFENEDILEFKKLDFESDFYSEIQKRNSQSLSRDRIKNHVMVWLNLSEPNERDRLKNVNYLKDLFPSINTLIESIGFFQDMKSAIALLLQRAESHLVLEIVAKELINKYPNLKIFTIHDSLLIQNHDLDIDEISKGIKNLLEGYTSIRPGIKQKVLNPFESFSDIVSKDIKNVKSKANKIERNIYNSDDRIFNPNIIKWVELGIWELNEPVLIESEFTEFKLLLNKLYKDF